MTKAKFKQDVKSFFSNGTFASAFDQILAMFPAAILMPMVINTTIGYNMFNVAYILLMSGVSTLIFLIITKGKVPSYLASSFAFIGVTIYIVNSLKNMYTPEEISGYVAGAYILSGLILLLLSFLTRITKNGQKNAEKWINKFIPPAVMGPAISLIGLELSETAATQAGLTSDLGSINAILALITILLVIFLSITHRKFLQKSSIFIAVVIAVVISAFAGVFSITSVVEAQAITLPFPNFILPRFSLSVFLMIIPPTFILFCEHIGRTVMIDNILSTSTKINKTYLPNSLLGNGVTNTLIGFLGGVPTTIYAENLAVMRINKDSRSNQFYIAAVITILISFSGHIMALVNSIPESIIGGLTLVLMAIIAAPGIKMLVDKKVDYSKISNLFLTSIVLIVGISKIQVTFGATVFKGMSLGIMVGIIFNLVILLLRRFEKLSEALEIEDVKGFCNEISPDIEVKEDNNRTQFLFNNILFAEIIIDSAKKMLNIIGLHEKESYYISNFSVYPNPGGWLSICLDPTVSEVECRELLGDSFNAISAEQTSLEKAT